jgi:membrane protein involved in colicin uptake
MSWIITIAGWAQIVAGGFFLAYARGAMHEATAAVAIGMGVVALALGRMLQYREEDDARRADAERKEKWEARKIV